MSDNVQKLPLGRSLLQGQRRTVLEHIQLMSGRAPATLVKAQDGTNTIWTVKFDTDGTYTLPMIKVPVHGSEYQRVPYQEGAKGFVGASDFETGNMTGLRTGKSPVDFTRPGNLSSMVWHPLGNTDLKKVIDPNAHETYGAAGGTITHDGTAKSLVKTHADKGTSVSSGGDGSGAPGPHEMATSTSGTSIKTPMPHKLDAKNATLKENGDQTNEGTSTSKSDITSTSGNITAAAGNVSAPGGMVSGALGSFLSALMGGLKFSGGRVSGGGGGGSGGGFQVADEEVSAQTLRTYQAYTVTQLNQLMPPSSGMAGVRAYVTDAAANVMFTPNPDPNAGNGTPTPLVQFGSVLQGGGQAACAAVCLPQGGGQFAWTAG